MSAALEEVANLLPPIESSVAVVAVTTSSAATDVLASAQLNYTDGIIGMIFTVPVWFFMSDVNTGTVSGTATTGATRGLYWPADSPIFFKPRGNRKYLVIKGQSAGYAHLWVAGDTGSVI